ncbi:MAG: ECF transporter S component [Clostridiales Family XIII bacterium]|jgi:uncharacterized membrane protein|nr:ECF transporter S component [Clostridiales Family XIII bacterium]
MKDGGLQRFTRTALMAAIIFVVTYIIRIPLPFASGGYLNIGDAPIYLSAYLLGGPAGAIAGAIGAAASDLAAGYVFYVAPTAAIKGVMGFVCGSLMSGGPIKSDSLGVVGPARKGGTKRFVLASALGGAIMVGGYAVFEAIFFNINQALAAIPFNCIQWAGGVAAAAALFPVARAIEKTLR